MAVSIPSTPFSLPTTNILPPAPVNPVTATSYTFAAIDAQGYTVFTAATPVTATISKDFFPVGTQLTSEQGGVGSVVVMPGVGVTFNPPGPRGTIGQYAVIAFFQKFQNVWTCTGAFI